MLKRAGVNLTTVFPVIALIIGGCEGRLDGESDLIVDEFETAGRFQDSSHVCEKVKPAGARDGEGEVGHANEVKTVVSEGEHVGDTTKSTAYSVKYWRKEDFEHLQISSHPVHILSNLGIHAIPYSTAQIHEVEGSHFDTGFLPGLSSLCCPVSFATSQV